MGELCNTKKGSEFIIILKINRKYKITKGNYEK